MHALWTLLAFCSVVAAAVVSAVVICFHQAQMYRGFSLGHFRDQQASLVCPEADDTLRRRGWVRPRTLLVLRGVRGVGKSGVVGGIILDPIHPDDLGGVARAKTTKS